MKVARAAEYKRREPQRVFVMKFLDQSRRRREAQSRAPVARIDRWQVQWLISPRVVEIKMQSASQKNYFGVCALNRVSLALATRRFSSASVSFGSRRNASSYCKIACEVLPSRKSKLPKLL